MRIIPLFSSSKGNATLVKTDCTNILIDVGVSGRSITSALEEINILPNNIDAIFITHEHSDHIQGVGVLSRKFDIPVFALENTWKYINKFNKFGKINFNNINVIHKEEKYFINEVCVVPFPVSHDSSDMAGFKLFTNNRKVSVATDIGMITPSLIESLSGSHEILVEANHDVDMLKNGSYPYILKKRILSQTGHLSNVDCGRLLSSIDFSNLEKVFLAHLSEENNSPILAYNTVKHILEVNEISVNLSLACGIGGFNGVYQNQFS